MVQQHKRTVARIRSSVTAELKRFIAVSYIPHLSLTLGRFDFLVIYVWPAQWHILHEIKVVDYAIQKLEYDLIGTSTTRYAT